MSGPKKRLDRANRHPANHPHMCDQAHQPYTNAVLAKRFCRKIEPGLMRLLADAAISPYDLMMRDRYREHRYFDHFAHAVLPATFQTPPAVWAVLERVLDDDGRLHAAADKRMFPLLSRLPLLLRFVGLGRVHRDRSGQTTWRVLTQTLDLLAQKDDLILEAGDGFPKRSILCEEFGIVRKKLGVRWHRLIGHAYPFTSRRAKDSQ